MEIRIATRKSLLARAQAEWTAHELTKRGHTCSFVPVTTQGDRDQNRPLDAAAEPGLFTREIEATLLRGDADIAVHSLKDLPLESRDGLILAAVPAREDSRDLLLAALSSPPLTLQNLPQGAKVATSSPRRAALLLDQRPDLEIIAIRGNVETRLRKIDEGLAAVTLLAQAGLNRLSIDRPRTPLPLDVFPAAPGQGALGIQARSEGIAAVVNVLEDAVTRTAVDAERAILAAMGGGCYLALGASAWQNADGGWTLSAFANLDGRPRRSLDQDTNLSALIQRIITALR